MQQLVGPEELFLFVLLSESATPHEDPAQMDISALVTLLVLLSEVFRDTNDIFVYVLAAYMVVFFLRGTVSLESYLLEPLHDARVDGRHDPVVVPLDLRLFKSGVY